MPACAPASSWCCSPTVAAAWRRRGRVHHQRTTSPTTSAPATALDGRWPAGRAEARSVELRRSWPTSYKASIAEPARARPRLTEGWDCSPPRWSRRPPTPCSSRPTSAAAPTSIAQARRRAGGPSERIAREGTLHGARAARDGSSSTPSTHWLTHPARDRPPPGRWRFGRAALPASNCRGAVASVRAGPRPRRWRSLSRGRTAGARSLPPDHHAGALARPYLAGAERPRRPLRHARRPLALALERPDPRRARLRRGPGQLPRIGGLRRALRRRRARRLGPGWKAAQDDILLATDALVARGLADPARLALIGGSYGGYMACWLPTRTDRFACAVVHAPVYNTTGMCAGDVTQGVEREFGGEPWDMPRARENIERWNPAAHTAGYRTPTLVTHGEKDFRCPVQHGLELYGMLRAKGVLGAARPLPRREPLDPQAAQLDPLVRRGALAWLGALRGLNGAVGGGEAEGVGRTASARERADPGRPLGSAC